MSYNDPIMNRGYAILLAGFALLSAVAPTRAQGLQGDAPMPAGHELFDQLWPHRGGAGGDAALLGVVRVTGPASPAPGRRIRLPIRVLRSIPHDPQFEPFDTHVLPNSSPQELIWPEQSEQRYLLMLFRPEHEAENPPEADWLARAEDNAFIPLEGEDPPALDIICELIFSQSAGGEEVDRFERLLHYLQSDSQTEREFAIRFLTRYNEHQIPDPNNPDHVERFAQAMLTVRDAEARTRMGMIYSVSGADMIPADPNLLLALVRQPGGFISRNVLSGNLRHAGDRAEQLQPVLHELLVGPGKDASRSLMSMTALVHWGERALVLEPELRAIALHETPASAEERVMAVWLLLRLYDDEPAAELAMRTLAVSPTVTGLKLLVDRGRYDLVPAVIEAVRAGRLNWTDSHAKALAILTGQPGEMSFDDFDRWWAGVESQGRVEESLADGFGDAGRDERVAELLGQLVSPSFEQRQQARAALLAMQAASQSPVLAQAAESPRAEVAETARLVLARQEQTFGRYQESLNVAGRYEQRGRVVIPPVHRPQPPRPEWPTSQPTSQPTSGPSTQTGTHPTSQPVSGPSS